MDRQFDDVLQDALFDEDAVVQRLMYAIFAYKARKMLMKDRFNSRTRRDAAYAASPVHASCSRMVSGAEVPVYSAITLLPNRKLPAYNEAM